MKNKTYLLSEEQINQLKVDYKFTLTSNMTLSIQQHYPPVFLEVGINKPDEQRNSIWGTTVSKKSVNEWLFGITRYDLKDQEPNEDHYLLNFDTRILEKFKGTSFEKIDSRYLGTHRGLKNYLKQSS